MWCDLVKSPECFQIGNMINNKWKFWLWLMSKAFQAEPSWAVYKISSKLTSRLAQARAEMWLGSKARAEPRAGSVFLFILKLFTFYNFHSSIQQINTIVFKLKQECKRNPKTTSNETDPKKLYINHNGICLFYNLFTQL